MSIVIGKARHYWSRASMTRNLYQCAWCGLKSEVEEGRPEGEGCPGGNQNDGKEVGVEQH